MTIDDEKITMGVFDPMVVRGIVEEVLKDKVEEYAAEGMPIILEKGDRRSYWGFRSWYNLYLNPDKKGCFVSVKVPRRNAMKGEALHANTRYMIDPKRHQGISFSVYPHKKEGRGHYWSKSIHRTKALDNRTSWKKRIAEYVDEGVDYCITAYGYGSKDVPTLMSEKGLEGIPLMFQKSKSGIADPSRQYCNLPGTWYYKKMTDPLMTEEKKKLRKSNLCKRIEAVRADDPKDFD